MIDKNNILEIFPTPLYVVTDVLTEEENDELVNHILSIQDREVGKGKDLWHSGVGSPKNSFGLELKDKEFDLILQRAHFHVGQYVKTLDADVRIDHMHKQWWWNVYDNHNYQEYHSHVPHLFSGVYYARVPKGSSDIKLRHPGWNINIPHVNQNKYNSDTCNFKLYERVMIIFPSTLLHCVPSGENTEPRISFSFNYG